MAAQLAAAGLNVQYEALRIGFTPEPKRRSYRPDFILPNGIVVETKGRFVTADRQKHRAIAQEHPDLDIRFVFSRSKTRLNRTSETTYGDWCERYGFLYADLVVPEEWMTEPKQQARIKALVRATL